MRKGLWLLLIVALIQGAPRPVLAANWFGHEELIERDQVRDCLVTGAFVAAVGTLGFFPPVLSRVVELPFGAAWVEHALFGCGLGLVGLSAHELMGVVLHGLKGGH
ncbi:MAG: hypothetical protein GC191_20790 [Azospirillum sp.]|nr:hypothetical protein [Azospirillum sp.]